ncbi:MAG: alkaline phosphatase [Chitinophagales bacterium]|nr:alkaline phosphatase [Chitinophagales bacterium]
MKLRFLLPLLVIISACAGNRQQSIDYKQVKLADRPKNIILMIGDGMAMSQISAGIYWKGVGHSAFEHFPYVGFHKSYSCDNLVTDSAAGATAFSCGERTENNRIATLPDNRPCRTILESLEAKGWATGIVVTCSATHATPASFIAHQELRAFSEEIALDYLDTPFDCYIGGGKGYFNQRPDKRNLLDSLRKRGYVVHTGFNFNSLPLDGSKPFALFTYDREPPTASAGRKYLPKATSVACNFLDKRSEKGFFLMVEGSQIDWAGHANDRNWLRAEMLDFDKTVQAALDFAARDGETLVIVTGDHECGGAALTKGENKREPHVKFTSRLHTGAMVPVLAFGPGAEKFSGIYDNKAIFLKMQEALISQQ